MSNLKTSNINKRFNSALNGLLAFAFVSVCAVSVAEAQVTLEDIAFTSLPEEIFEIELIFNTTPPIPDIFEIESPARLSMDFTDVTNDLEERRYPLFFSLAESVMVLEAQGRTRMIVNLNSATDYDTRVQDNSLFITIGDAANISAVAEARLMPPIAPQTSQSIAPSVQQPAVVAQVAAAQAPPQVSQQNFEQLVSVVSTGDIDNVDFRRNTDGSGQIIVSLANSGVIGNVRQLGSRLLLEFPNADLEESMEMRLDVTDFATPVQFINVYSENDSVVVDTDIFGEFEYIASQSAEEYIINVTPVLANISAVNNNGEPFEYTGDRLDLNYQNLPVRSVLQILADFNDFNLVVSDTVSGSISLRLNDVPWDQALDIILTVRGLDQRLSGNVLYVAPAEEIATAELQELENNIQLESLAPLVTEYIDVNYAEAEQMLRLIEGSTDDDDNRNLNNNEEEASRILSSRGTASFDTRTNTLIVQDTALVITQIKEMLRYLDVPVQEVLIEARIVNASTQFSEALGVRWGTTQTLPNAGDAFILSGNIASATNGLVDGAVPNLSFPQALMVDLGVVNSSSSIALGYAGNNSLLQLELTALEDSGSGEVIAQPKIRTLDQQMARISSGVQVPYQAQAGGTAGGSTTEFISAELSLEVTPQITPDGKIIMLLDIHQDSVIPGAAGSVPAIATNQITTRVLVDDGSTIVLGGVFREEVSETVSKTPFLGDVPYLGSLFKRTEQFETKTELLIFITPSIINEFYQ